MTAQYSGCYVAVNSNGNARLNNNSYMATFGERIRARRKELGIGQPELARAVGVKQPTVSNIESGRNRGSAYVAQFAVALRCSAHWLATGKGKKEFSEPYQKSPADEMWERYQRSHPVIRQSIDTLLSEEALRLAEDVEPAQKDAAAD